MTLTMDAGACLQSSADTRGRIPSCITKSRTGREWTALAGAAHHQLTTHRDLRRAWPDGDDR
jgi:hypothetical protein